MAQSSDNDHLQGTGPAVLESVLTCPQCGHSRREVMPTDACLFFYECERCKAVLRPTAGACCVFCSYGSVKCPPMQLKRGGPAGGEGPGDVQKNHCTDA